MRVRHRRLLPTAGLFLVWLVLGCGEEGPAEIGGTLAVSPASVTVTPEAGGQFSLASTPAGARLEWAVTAQPTWATVTPSSGVIDGAVETVTVTVEALAEAEPGEYTGTVELISDGGAGSVALTAVVSPAPAATVTPASLAYGESQDTLTLEIRNTGRGALTWSLSSAGGHVSFSELAGELETGAHGTVTATALRDGLPVGLRSDTVIVTTNGTPAEVRVPVEIAVPPEPQALVEPGAVLVYAAVDTASVLLSNPGTGPLTWSATDSVTGIAVAPSSGVLAVGDTTRLVVTVDRAAFEDYGAAGSVTIESDADSALVLPVTLGRWTRAWTLDHRVVDAEFSRVTGRIITVSADPARLSIIDPVSHEVRHVDLGLTPSSVSVRRDGLFAAVGHNGYISLVDLTADAVAEVYAVTTDVLDVVLADSAWVYAFPRTDQWETIRSIELATGVETTSGTIYAGTVARLHPSGDYMYGANRGLSPSDFEKYDVRGGTATFMYDSPYHGDHSFGGDVWIADDGARLFARSGNVFRSSSVEAEDMLYAGALAGVSWARWVEHSSAAARIVVFTGADSSTELNVYETEFLALKGTVPLPPFVTPTGEHDANGWFVFADADGLMFHALVRADPAAGLAADWALISAPRDALP